MPPPVSAVPPTYHLRLRLRTSEGTVGNFANRAYRISWNGRTISGTTDADGVVTADLDARVETGILDLGEEQNGTFTAFITIPLRRIPPPPSPPRPLAPRQPSDPLPRPPTPPSRPLLRPILTEQNMSEWPRLRAEYEQLEREWADYYRALEEYNREMERRGHPTDEWAIVRPRRPPRRGRMTEQQAAEARAAYQASRDQYYRNARELYDISWRLANLGFYYGAPPEGFGFRNSSDYVELVDAIRRYTFKHHVEDGYFRDPIYIGPDGRSFRPDRHATVLWRHVRLAHDDREPPEPR